MSKAPPPCSSSAATTSSTRRSVRSPPLPPRHHKHRLQLRPARRSRSRAISRESTNESQTPTPPTIPSMKAGNLSQHAPQHSQTTWPSSASAQLPPKKTPKNPAGFVRKCLDLDDIATRPAYRRDATGMAPGHQCPLARGGPTCRGTGAPCTGSLARGLSDGEISCICAGCG